MIPNRYSLERSGLATVAGLASHGARVYMGARSKSKALNAIHEVEAQIPSADILFLEIDLTNLDSVIQAAKTIVEFVQLLVQPLSQYI
jgi:NAD(P)-dependent dehydrogenase (short-subunit alcohol dehydrogenase family)